MIKKIRDIYYGDLEHEHRFMLSLICAEFILIMFIKLWPATPVEPKTYTDVFTEDVIFIEKSIVTRQTTAPAAPPKPRIPVPVPDDQVIEEEIDFPDIDDIISRFDTDGEDGLSKIGGEGELVGSPEQPPGLVRIVEPTVPEAAKRANVKARITITFLVDARGEVEDAYISEIRVYDGDNYEIVNQIGYGLMEASMEAASKWKFRPAKDQGIPVKTYVENSFNFGF